jgi:hypothetical protein
MAGLVVDLPLKSQHLAIKVHPCNYIDDNNPQLRRSAPANANQYDVTRFIVVVAFISVSALTLSAITFSLIWFTLREQAPSLWLDSLSVPTFDTSDNSSLMAVYIIGLTYKQTNSRCKIYYEQIDVDVSYKRLYDLASATLQEPFRLGTETEKSVNVTAEDRTRWFWRDSAPEEINRAKEKGKVSFNVFVRAAVIFEGSWWKDRGVLAHTCSDLEVAFPNTSGTGNLIGDLPRKCTKIW